MCGPRRQLPARPAEKWRGPGRESARTPGVRGRWPSPPTPARAGTRARWPGSCPARRCGCRRRRRRIAGLDLRRLALRRRCGQLRVQHARGRRRSAQQPQLAGTVTESATASATDRSVSFSPIWVDEQVGCRAIADPCAVDVEPGQHVLGDVCGGVDDPQTREVTRPRSRSPACAAAPRCTRTRRRRSAARPAGTPPTAAAAPCGPSPGIPSFMPLDFHGVPQHSEAGPAGR